MSRELLTWCSTLVFLCLLALSACESTSTAPKAEEHGSFKKENQLKDAYDIMTKSNEKGHQRRYEKMHVVHHLEVSQKAKGTYGGSSDLTRPKNSHAASSSLKPPTISFSAIVMCLTIGWFIFALF